MNMKIAYSVRLGIGTLIGINLLMAFCCIWIFLRMAPAIDQIILRNVNSLRSGRIMLTALTYAGDAEKNADAVTDFEVALDAASKNITELHEPENLAAIEANYKAAFQGDPIARLNTVTAIDRLCETNINAMIKADFKARRLGVSGAWGVVFMASGVFFIGMLVARFLIRRLIFPLEEIYTTLESRRSGDQFRLCTVADSSDEMFRLLTDINDLLGQNSPNNADFASLADKVEII